jgi:ribosomal protein S6--L-glutamate ligase
LGAGARFEPARLPASFQRVAEQTANLVGLEVAAIDMLDLKDGPRVFEVNSSPGIKEIEEVTGVDVAREVVARAVELAQAKKNFRPLAASKPGPRAGAEVRKRAAEKPTRKTAGRKRSAP